MDICDIPRCQLGFFPTPLVELKALSSFLAGPRVFIKRDDMTGLAFGGNKTRKLEFLIAEALASGCDTIITGGAAQSNHCRQTAAAAAIYGLECHLVLGGSCPKTLNGNLLLDQLLNSHIHWKDSMRKGENMAELADKLRSEGKNPYLIPYGGSNPTGTLGYVIAVKELSLQAMELGHSFTHTVFASSSGGTHAGILTGKNLYRQQFEVLGIAIDKRPPEEPDFNEFISGLANATAGKLGLEMGFTKKHVLLNSNYLGKGYGIVGELEKEAIQLLAKLEAIILDPVYTARAMGGLIDMMVNKEFSKKDRILFWHTGGGPSVFAYSEEII
jgi:D-cysteine desulfhydrase